MYKFQRMEHNILLHINLFTFAENPASY
jgi:hypothetical protein